MKFCVLASGSKGNCTYIEVDNHKYLIDVGMNFLYTANKLEEIGIDSHDIEGIFITHIHDDHIKGLKRFIKVVNPTIYLSKKIYDNIDIEIEKYILLEEDLQIENMYVETLKLSHDTPECKGYIFNSLNSSLVYITDTGYINNKYFAKLTNKTAYIIESNHDIDMLMKSTRPHYLKMRIIGDEGHISNNDCAYYLSKFVGKKTKYIVLAHISQDNNDPALAIKSVKETISTDNIIVAKQDERLEVVSL